MIARIATQLDIQMIHMDKFVTIVTHKAESKYDFNKPTLLYDSTGVNGHFGLLVRESGVKKIPF